MLKGTESVILSELAFFRVLSPVYPSNFCVLKHFVDIPIYRAGNKVLIYTVGSKVLIYIAGNKVPIYTEGNKVLIYTAGNKVRI